MEGKLESQLAGLLRAALAGDEKAYRDFLVRTAGVVRGFARRRVQGGVDPDDVVQETLLAIHLKRHTWHPGAPVMPWLYAIARHKLVDAFRLRGRQLEIGVEEIADVIAQPEVATVSEWEMARVLDTLSPGQRSIVAAISVNGRSISDTAKTLGMSESAVRVGLHRGLAAIAKRFG